MTSEATGHVAFDMAGVVAAIAGSSSNFRRLQQRVADELRDSYLGNSSTASNSNGSSKGEEGDDAQILAEYILHLLVKENASVDRLSEELKEFLGPPTQGFVQWLQREVQHRSEASGGSSRPSSSSASKHSGKHISSGGGSSAKHSAGSSGNVRSGSSGASGSSRHATSSSKHGGSRHGSSTTEETRGGRSRSDVISRRLILMKAAEDAATSIKSDSGRDRRDRRSGERSRRSRSRSRTPVGCRAIFLVQNKEQDDLHKSGGIDGYVTQSQPAGGMWQHQQVPGQQHGVVKEEAPVAATTPAQLPLNDGVPVVKGPKAILKPNPRFVEAMYSADLRGEAMHVEGMATGPPPVYPVATPMLQQQLMQHPQPMQQSQHQLVAQQPSQAGVLAGAPYVPKVKKRCIKWPDCPFGSNCAFIHPTVRCVNFPRCPYGGGCFYIHPPIKCKFGAACRNPTCNFVHDEKPEGMGPVGNGGFYKNIVWTKDGQHESQTSAPDAGASANGEQHAGVAALSFTLPSTPPSLKRSSSASDTNQVLSEADAIALPPAAEQGTAEAATIDQDAEPLEVDEGL